MISVNSPIKPKFPLGQILATPGAIEALNEAGQTPLEFIARHAACDWGDMSPDDKLLNDEALVDGSRIMSAYRTSKNIRIWIITEAADENGHRCATTALLPSEY